MPITGADLLRYKAQHKPKTASQLAVEALTPPQSPPDADVLRAIGLRNPPRTFVRAAQISTTVPKAPPANAAPSLPINRPRATGLYLCHDCGQTWRIERAGGTFNQRRPLFCPACGTHNLLPAQDVFSGLDAGCFRAAQVERKLAQLMYQQWAANQHHEQDKHARFVDYLKEELS